MVNQTSTEISDLIIRRCHTDDAAILSLIGASTFLETFYDSITSADILAHAAGPHSVEYYRAALEADDMIWLAVHRETGTPIGYQMLSTPDLPIDTVEYDIELKRIYIFTRHHGSGIAQKMEKIACDNALKYGYKRLLLGVCSKNIRAISFYKKCGFEKIGTRIFTVGNTDYTDWIMAKIL